ncbi:winged helix DNA-binding protein [Rhizorhabdus dicambivorans]|uniref:winged helix DNA-binding protein n=1 Tax=Rhizorhabdus dicambivorans TaxID=1850238 RepID=UPI001EE06109|nr:winged helix DNA-binding protein [Rhizorhabdus dicambivorans]
MTALGGRVAGELPVVGAAERLDLQVAVDLVIADVGTDHGPQLDRLLDRIEAGSVQGRFASIIVVAPELIDIVSARIAHEGVSLLVGPDEEALALAIGERLRWTEPQLRDTSDGGQGQPIQNLLEELARFARSAADGQDDDAFRGDDRSLEPPSREIDEVAPVEAGLIRELIRARRLRDELFGPGLFADPAWDILLDLTAARIEGRSVAVSSLCIAAAVPATTALRWIKQLTDSGLLRRVADPDDGRRIFIELTDRAAHAMMTYFANAARAGKG